MDPACGRPGGKPGSTPLSRLTGLLACLLAGCAAPAAGPQAAADEDCVMREAPIGSHVPRAVRCPGTSAASGAERDAQREHAERIREDQNRRNQPRPPAGPGG